MSTNPKSKRATAPRERRVFPTKVKCEAVLAVWAERRRPTEICRELGIPWQQLNVWQQRCMSAMMSALEPPQTAEAKPALSPRLARLLETTQSRTKRSSKLEKRLETIQKTGPTPPSKP